MKKILLAMAVCVMVLGTCSAGGCDNPRAWVKVETLPTGAQVKVNGLKQRGASPMMVEVNLESEAWIDLEKQGFRPLRLDVTWLQPGATNDLGGKIRLRMIEPLDTQREDAGRSDSPRATARTERSDNHLSIVSVYCPPGSFVMGSPFKEAIGETDENQVNVTISEGFWLGKFEVTQAQWKGLMNHNPSKFKLKNRPVENVSWNEAVEFCRRLSVVERRAGRLGEDQIYRLPTEAEWEYACRAGSTGRFWSGDKWTGKEGYSRPRGIFSHWPDSTARVGSYQPNRWGLHDMHGNVWEWCQDRYAATYRGGTDPVGSKSGKRRVFRGGSFNCTPVECRSANRARGSPADPVAFFPSITRNYIGFRIVLGSLR